MDSREIQAKRKAEQVLVDEMIRMYCKHHHKTDGLCPDCQELMAYTQLRTEKCPFMETKTFCSNCKVHCYKPEMRAAIKQVMRWCGPRMLFYHPILAIKHLWYSKLNK